MRVTNKIMVVQCPNPTQKISERGLGHKIAEYRELYKTTCTEMDSTIMVWWSGQDTISRIKITRKEDQIDCKDAVHAGALYEHTAVEGGVTILNACVLH